MKAADSPMKTIHLSVNREPCEAAVTARTQLAELLRDHLHLTSTHLGHFPGLALFDFMKPYMPPSPRNLERLHRDVHHRRVEMWAGCIWAPIYEAMSRKRLTIVTLEENLPMARDIGMTATTSLETAFAETMTRHGPDAKVVVLPFARYQMPADVIRMPSDAAGTPASWENWPEAAD